MEATLLKKTKILQKFKSSETIQDASEFLTLVACIGIKMIGKVNKEFLTDEKFVKDLINIDPYSLFYLSEDFYNDKYFREVKKRHEILLLNPINKKLTKSTINWLVENCPEYVNFEFLKKPFAQLGEDSALLRQRIGLGFLIAGVEVPGYLASDVSIFEHKTKEELIEIKKTILNYEKVEEMLTYEKLNVKIKVIKI